MGDTRLEPLVLSDDERRTLENWVRRRSTAQGLAQRARIVLACADGGSNVAVAARLGVNYKTVSRWRSRFLRKRLDGLSDEPRPGVPRTITDAQVEEVVVRTLEETPEGATHWSKRELARQVGISPASVHRIWRAVEPVAVCTSGSLTSGSKDDAEAPEATGRVGAVSRAGQG